MYFELLVGTTYFPYMYWLNTSLNVLLAQSSVLRSLQVYAWGRGEHGRLGFGDDKSSHMVPLKVQLLAGEDIVQVVYMGLKCCIEFLYCLLPISV